MNADDLKALQAPIKERYRQSPEAARIAVRARGTLGANITCSLDTPRGPVVAGLHPAAGGSGLEAYLDSEVLRYRAQLERYARIVASREARPIRLGLYFPLLDAWREWPYEAP